MKRSKQKVIVQDHFSGLHLLNVRRTVRDIENHGEYWTGETIVNGVEYQVKLVSQPGQVDTWYNTN